MDKRIAIITGASKGIGKAIAQRMITENYITILVDVDKENGEALAKELGDSAQFISCDISKERDVPCIVCTSCTSLYHRNRTYIIRKVQC